MNHKNKKSLWTPIVHFAGHAFIGTTLFLIVGFPAVALNLLVKFLVSVGIDGFTVAVLEFLEHAILLVDAVLFLVFLGVTAYKSVKEMLDHDKDD